LTQTVLNKLRVLFVDDEAPIRDVMRLELPRMGHEATICEDGQAAKLAIDKHTFDVAIIDLWMPGISGWDVVEHLKAASPETDIIISTGHGNMEDAIQALRRGAYDFLTKPTKLAVIAGVLSRVAERRALTHKTIALEKRLHAVQGSPEIVGTSPAMERVKKLIDKIAPTDSAVMILGETGTGKELVARRIHHCSRRAQMPFVAVNCGALPEHLVESELFGHRKGAFTGAESTRRGLIEVANGGTLFLDELGELDRAIQVKLLRVLESGEVRRLGENEAFHVDVRVVCATNRNLEEMVQKGEFRQDLFFRVNTFEIGLPALRERRDDIPALAQSLIARHLPRSRNIAGVLSDEVLALLKQHDWRGNVRELANALEHAVILSEGNPISVNDLPTTVSQPSRKGRGGFGIFDGAHPRTLREMEVDIIIQALDKHGGDKRKAARELGIALKTLYNKLNQVVIQSDAG
jgi:DNA-binding NtrC family response regulator